ncbi:hypothetical protein BKH46_08935 [Helicobacter sp. 12S02634-8]|nr:hypothetical protein BKH46_08935 [Helicobacter sp. 12S02634-8]
MRWICFITALLILLEGCGYPVYEKVYIPTHCEIPLRERPQKSEDLVENIKNLLGYVELLESDLRFCVGGLRP